MLRYQYLNSIMILLIHDIEEFRGSICIFKFHYVSINSIESFEYGEEDSTFKFHYDSINS